MDAASKLSKEVTPAKGSLTSGKLSSPRMDTPAQPQPEVDMNLSAKLFSSLRTLRTILVKEAGEGVMAYHIFGNATLKHISERIPRTKEELLETNGIGERKINKYGDRILETIESTIREYYKIDKNSSGSNDSTDSMKRKREPNWVLNSNLEDDNDFTRSTSSSKERATETQEKNAENLAAKLHSSLRTLRSILVKEAGEGVMAYHIFVNATLQHIIERIPRTKEELLEIKGIGEAKVNKYGDRILETIESTVREYYKIDKNSSISNDSIDSMKRRRERNRVLNSNLEDDNSFTRGTGPSKKRATGRQDKNAEVYDTKQPYYPAPPAGPVQPAPILDDSVVPPVGPPEAPAPSAHIFVKFQSALLSRLDQIDDRLVQFETTIDGRLGQLESTVAQLMTKVTDFRQCFDDSIATDE